MNGPFMLRRRAVSLIEVLIAMTLLMLLLGSLFSWYHHLTGRKGELEKCKRAHLEEYYVWQRLEQILPKAQAPFYAEDDALVFRFDRGLHSDPLLSETVLGKIYFDSRLQTLCLGIWPDPKQEEVRTPCQTFTLVDNVDSFKFALYSPPDPFPKPVDPEQIGKPRPIPTWQNTWLAEYETLPALVCLVIEREGKERALYFDLNQPIIYPAEIG
ncbi:MAG: hypothetical protein S4CHLAM2_04870 [Chlamydiales bacterium]|nr:hypothetical protein [Chlamydiales bacterium]